MNYLENDKILEKILSENSPFDFRFFSIIIIPSQGVIQRKYGCTEANNKCAEGSTSKLEVREKEI